MNKIEQIARILCPERPDDTNAMTGDDGSVYPVGIPHWKQHENQAREIILALREPTREMLIIDGNFSAAFRAAIWREMIDEILK